VGVGGSAKEGCKEGAIMLLGQEFQACEELGAVCEQEGGHDVANGAEYNHRRKLPQIRSAGNVVPCP
jgi:hypothetical protein